MADHQKPYGKWTREELRSAEATARQFLEDNSSQIADTMRAKAKYLETLIQRVAHPENHVSKTGWSISRASPRSPR